MATVTTLPSGARPERLGLSFWMNRVRKELERVRIALDEDAVHDLRVAIRRCRSLAAVLQEADPTPGWKRMRKIPRKLFRELGVLRDAQVLADWLKRLTPEVDPLRSRLLHVLEEREKVCRATALRAVERFDEAAWKQLARKLPSRARLVPPGGLAAQCLALERFVQAHELHARALRTERPKPWHELRIGLKRFRYTAENLLPEQYPAWEENLKRVQDLLGDLHDLDVLAALAKQETASAPAESAEALRATLEHERAERLAAYRQLTLGRNGLWRVWRSGLPQGKELHAAATARLRATARALDSHPRRTARISRLALRLFGAFATAGVSPLFREAQVRVILRAAARLHGIGGGRRQKSPQKAARNFLKKMPVPPGWSAAEWNLLASTVRYHRGSEPKTKHRGFGALSEKDKHVLQGLAGILRLARALRRCGGESVTGFRAQQSLDAMLLRIPGWINSEENAERIAAGKHLLEIFLKRPLLIESVVNVFALPEKPPKAAGQMVREIAAASD